MRPTDLDDFTPPEPTDDLLARVRERSGSFRRRRRTQRFASLLSGAVIVALVVGVLIARGDDGARHLTSPDPAVTSTTTLPPAVAAQLDGFWLPTSVNGYRGPLTHPPLNYQPVLRFGGDGHWSGSDGCNDLGGTYEYRSGGAFHIATHLSSAVLCSQVLPLQDVFTAVRIEVVDDRLTFLARDGHELARYRSERITARVELSRTTIAAGSTFTGWVVVHNDTGHGLRASRCNALFQVVLGNARIKPEVAWDKCRGEITIPVGGSKYPVRISANYDTCTGDAAHATAELPACVDGGLPPLPIGEYSATLYQSEPVVPTPPPITVEVVEPNPSDAR